MTTTLDINDEILPWQASEIIGVSENTLTKWRCKGIRTRENPEVPRAWKRFGRVYYSRTHCIEFRKRNTLPTE